MVDPNAAIVANGVIARDPVIGRAAVSTGGLCLVGLRSQEIHSAV